MELRKGGSSEGRLGFEAGYRKAFFARCGYRFNEEDLSFGDLDGFSFGFGVKWYDGVLDYAMASNGDLGSTHSFSLSWFFPQKISPQKETPRKATLKKTAPKKILEKRK